MRLLSIALAFSLATACFADTITMKNGRVINGTFLGGTARQIRVDTGDRVQNVDVDDIARIEFGGPLAEAPPPEPRPAMRAEPEQQPVMRPAPRDDQDRRRGSGEMTLPAGTNFVVRTIDAVDSETARTGQNFAATLDEPIVDGAGNTLIPRGADVTLKLVDAKQSGKITGRTELALSLMSVKIDGQMVDINTQTVTQVSDSRGGRSAKTIGGGAVAGAIIGGIIGGGKGAAVGAGAGGAAGAGVEMATKGQRVRIPSETRLTFVLDNPVKI
jgi:hypothetical protein